MTNVKKYESKNPLVQKMIKRFLSRVEGNLKGIEYNSLIDIGCGEAFVLKRLSPKGRVMGIDMSAEALQMAKKKFPKAVYKKASIYKIPAKSNSFDVALCLEVIEHLDNPDKAVAEIKRVAKNAIISVPESLVFRTLNLARLKNIERMGEDPEHVQRFTKSKFRKLLQRHFKHVKVKRSVPWLIAKVSR